MSKIVICGNYGASNLGDELILAGILSFCHSDRAIGEWRNLQDDDITVLSANPSETSKRHNIKSENLIPSGFRSFFRSFSWLRCHSRERGNLFSKSLNAIKDCDQFILGGGGLFTDEKLRAVFIWYIQALTASIYKKKIYILANSIGPLKTKIGRFFTRKALKMANKITVRDNASKELAVKLGIPEDKITVTADPAFLLGRPDTIYHSRPRFQRVLISLRPFKNLTPKILKEIQLFMDYLIEKENLKILLLPFQEQNDDDLKILSKIKKSAFNDFEAKIELLSPSLDFNEVFDIFSKSKYVLGMRFHSLILSTMANTPFLSISYSDKNSNYLKDIDYNEADLKPKNISSDLLIQKFLYLKNNYLEIQNLLESASKQQSEKAKMNF